MDSIMLVKVLVKDAVKRLIREAGLEKALELIEKITNIKQRLWMREAYYELIAHKQALF